MVLVEVEFAIWFIIVEQCSMTENAEDCAFVRYPVDIDP